DGRERGDNARHCGGFAKRLDVGGVFPDQSVRKSDYVQYCRALHRGVNHPIEPPFARREWGGVIGSCAVGTGGKSGEGIIAPRLGEEFPILKTQNPIEIVYLHLEPRIEAWKLRLTWSLEFLQSRWPSGDSFFATPTFNHTRWVQPFNHP
ncbi:MAG: hypothetical protein ACI9OD_005254, partial [Limisphaerales bacterium]